MFIVVCPNTVVSKLADDWIAGEGIIEADEVIVQSLAISQLLINFENGAPLARPRTILIDTA